MKRILAVAPWIDVIAVIPFVVLVLVARDPLYAFGSIDPFILFRLFVLLWVLVHVIVILRRFAADIRSVRDMLCAVDGRLGLDGSAARTGERILKWSIWRVAGLSLRHGWTTLLLLAVIVSVNLTAMLVLVGRL